MLDLSFSIPGRLFQDPHYISLCKYSLLLAAANYLTCCFWPKTSKLICWCPGWELGGGVILVQPLPCYWQYVHLQVRTVASAFNKGSGSFHGKRGRRLFICHSSACSSDGLKFLYYTYSLKIIGQKISRLRTNCFIIFFFLHNAYP